MFLWHFIPTPPHPHPGVDQEHRLHLVDVVVDDCHAEADHDTLGVVEPRVRHLVICVGPIEEILAEALAGRLFSFHLRVGRQFPIAICLP